MRGRRMAMCQRVRLLTMLFLLNYGVIILCSAFSPPSMSLGSLLFPVRSLEIQGLSEEEPSNKWTAVQDVSDFFVEAFWTAKVGGGARQLTDRQRSSLIQSQVAEFNRRYSGSRYKEAELLVARNSASDIIACAGVEVDRIPSDSLRGPTEKRAPLMSNLAVSRRYRRRGLAEQLVQAVEKVVEEWGYDECYLYVEERNKAALNLYRKLGYRKKWRDPSAKTLMPTKSGSLLSEDTVIVCMEKKKLKSGFLSRFF